ncbi:MAG TPA: XdhC family protein [Terracidiphilus sp.]|jgi:xanthine dehydrogenase accessory factor|nr:XdhC family protein [Terracidiphilus sp.]
MSDLGPIFALWHDLQTSGVDYVLATVVAVEGSSYRRPGARMLLARDGRRAGTVSGGCLEAEVARQAWWLTAAGPVIERYSTVEDDGERPYGSGCGGVIYLLLERNATADPLLTVLETAFQQRVPLALATILSGPSVGTRAVAADSAELILPSISPSAELVQLAQTALDLGTTFEEQIAIDGVASRVWAEFQPARPGLWIISAGDDAKPLVDFAQQLGWFVVIADGRSNLATRERFPTADRVRTLPIAELPDAARQYLDPRPTDAAIIMTHSFEPDSRTLASLLALPYPLAYLGVLGPQRRTRELLAEATRLLGRPNTTERIDQWLAQMHAPTGLDLGAATPATIALSIVAEVQKTLAAASGQPLHQVRAVKEIPAECG